MKHSERMKEELPRSTLRSLTDEECQAPGVHNDEMGKLKLQFKVIDQNEYYGAKVRAIAETPMFG